MSNQPMATSSRKCWFCQDNLSTVSSSLDMMLEELVSEKYTSTRHIRQIRKERVLVPRCDTCEEFHKKSGILLHGRDIYGPNDFSKFFYGTTAGLLGIFMTIFFINNTQLNDLVAALLGLVIGGIVAFVGILLLPFGIMELDKKSAFFSRMLDFSLLAVLLVVIVELVSTIGFFENDLLTFAVYAALPIILIVAFIRGLRAHKARSESIKVRGFIPKSYTTFYDYSGFKTVTGSGWRWKIVEVKNNEPEKVVTKETNKKITKKSEILERKSSIQNQVATANTATVTSTSAKQKKASNPGLGLAVLGAALSLLVFIYPIAFLISIPLCLYVIIKTEDKTAKRVAFVGIVIIVAPLVFGLVSLLFLI